MQTTKCNNCADRSFSRCVLTTIRIRLMVADVSRTAFVPVK